MTPPPATLTTTQTTALDRIRQAAQHRAAPNTAHKQAGASLRNAVLAAAGGGCANADIVTAINRAVTRQSVQILIKRAGRDACTEAWETSGQKTRDQLLADITQHADTYRDTALEFERVEQNLMLAIQNALAVDTPPVRIHEATGLATATAYKAMAHLRERDEINRILTNIKEEDADGYEVGISLAWRGVEHRVHRIIAGTTDAKDRISVVRQLAKAATEALAEHGWQVVAPEGLGGGEFSRVVRAKNN